MPTYIRIDKIICTNRSEGGDGDDVYIYCQSDAGFSQRFPQTLAQANPQDQSTFLPVHKMETDDVWLLGEDDPETFTFEFEFEFILSIYDQDLTYDPNTAKYLGNVTFEPQGTSFGGPPANEKTTAPVITMSFQRPHPITLESKEKIFSYEVHYTYVPVN